MQTTMPETAQLLKEFLKNDEQVAHWLAEIKNAQSMRGTSFILATLTEYLEEKQVPTSKDCVEFILQVLMTNPLNPSDAPYIQKLAEGITAYKGTFYTKSISFLVVTNDAEVKQALGAAIQKNTNLELFKTALKFENS